MVCLSLTLDSTPSIPQALGAVGGALAINEVMPQQYKHMLGGPSLKVDSHTGAIAEGVLTFIISFLVLVIILKGPRSSFLKSWLLVVTVALVVTGLYQPFNESRQHK